MDETYRMLGREHQADLEREAGRRALADRARPSREPWRPGVFRIRVRAVARLARARLRTATSP
jgi:hypothetical protein